MKAFIKRLHWAAFGLFVLAVWVGVNVLIDTMLGVAVSGEKLMQHGVSGILVGAVFALFRRRAQKEDEGPR